MINRFLKSVFNIKSFTITIFIQMILSLLVFGAFSFTKSYLIGKNSYNSRFIDYNIAIENDIELSEIEEYVPNRINELEIITNKDIVDSFVIYHSTGYYDGRMISIYYYSGDIKNVMATKERNFSIINKKDNNTGIYCSFDYMDFSEIIIEDSPLKFEKQELFKINAIDGYIKYKKDNSFKQLFILIPYSSYNTYKVELSSDVDVVYKFSKNLSYNDFVKLYYDSSDIYTRQYYLHKDDSILLPTFEIINHFIKISLILICASVFILLLEKLRKEKEDVMIRKIYYEPLYKIIIRDSLKNAIIFLLSFGIVAIFFFVISLICLGINHFIVFEVASISLITIVMIAFEILITAIVRIIQFANYSRE